MLSATRSFKLVKRLRNIGVVSKTFLQNYKERMTPVLSAIQGKAARDPKDQDYWKGIRNLFAYNDDTDCIPMNAANVCPNFDAVLRTVNDFNLELNLDVSIQNRVDVFSLIIDDAREEIAAQLGVTSCNVALMRNTTEANCAINNGLELGQGDEVLIWEQNYGTNKRAWTIRQQRSPFTVVTVPSDLDCATTQEEVVESFVSRLTNKTKVVAFSHLSNESGVLLPAKEICVAVHACNPDIHVHIDGAQTWGAMVLDLVDMDCDSYSASAQKWFFGPKESGILYMRQSRVPDFMPNLFGYDGKMVMPEDLYDDARRFETLGQRSDPTLMGLLNAADLLGCIGYEAIDARIQYLGGLVYSGFQDLGFPITTPADPTRRHGVIIAGLDAETGNEIYQYLYDVHKIGVANTGGLRVSPTILNTESQIEKLIEAIREFPNYVFLQTGT